MAKLMVENVEGSTGDLKRYQELKEKRNALQEMVRNAEAGRKSVKQSIYERVVAEYEKEIQAIDNELKPLQKDLDASRKAMEKELGNVTSRLEDLTDNLEELAFRHRVGEYAKEEATAKEDSLKNQIDELETRRNELSESLESIGGKTGKSDNDGGSPDTSSLSEEPSFSTDDANVGEQPLKTDDAAKDAESPAPQGPTDEGEDEKNRETNVESEAADDNIDLPDEDQDATSKDDSDTLGDSLVNPSEWTREFRGDTDSIDQPAKDEELSLDTDDDDPLAGLTEQSESETTSSQPSKPKRKSDAKTQALVITEGPSSGKRIPLIPMTMTIGREHDNNIEIKDEEVARYHARISYRRGEHVLEDLQSSSGTWVNGTKVETASLQHNDTIRVGKTEIKIDFGKEG